MPLQHVNKLKHDFDDCLGKAKLESRANAWLDVCVRQHQKREPLRAYLSINGEHDRVLLSFTMFYLGNHADALNCCSFGVQVALFIPRSTWRQHQCSVVGFGENAAG